VKQRTANKHAIVPWRITPNATVYKDPTNINYKSPKVNMRSLIQIGKDQMYYEGFKIIGMHCGLVVRVSGYRSRGPGLDSRPYQIF
jgi:hypothetical protein